MLAERKASRQFPTSAVRIIHTLIGIIKAFQSLPTKGAPKVGLIRT